MSEQSSTERRKVGRVNQKDGTEAVEITIESAEHALALTGSVGEHLRVIEEALDVTVGLRGQTLRILGHKPAVTMAKKVVLDTLSAISKGRHPSESDWARNLNTVKRHPDANIESLMQDVVLVGTDRKTIAPKGLAQQRYVQKIREHDLVFGIGPAGTGKTYLAMAMAVKSLLDKQVKRIVLARPAVEAGEKLGFLPGDLAEKVNPYLRPLYDALYDMMDYDRAQQMIQRGIVEVAPLAFMRGRTLNESFVILDEAQNTTPEQMKMFLTRLGYDAKAVVTGDVTQIDLPEGRLSGLRDAAVRLKDVDGIGFEYFTEADVVRHPLVQRIIRAYDRSEKNPSVSRADS